MLDRSSGLSGQFRLCQASCPQVLPRPCQHNGEGCALIGRDVTAWPRLRSHLVLDRQLASARMREVDLLTSYAHQDFIRDGFPKVRNTPQNDWAASTRDQANL